MSSAKRRSAASSSASALLVEARHGERSRERLQLGPDEERLAQLLARERADADAAVRHELDEPERGQPSQRLADRRPRDPVLLGERLLAEDRARLDLAGDDRLLEGVRDLVGLGGLHAEPSAQSSPKKTSA